MAKLHVANLLAHWDSIVPLHVSPLQFYAMIEHAIGHKDLPDVVMSRAFWQQGGWLSSRRQYLRVRRKRLAFDICAIPIGDSFQVSWWLSEITPGPGELFFEIPILGPLLEHIICPVTFYQVDTALHFQHSVHEAVLQVIDGMKSMHGTRQIAEQNRQPVMNEFYE